MAPHISYALDKFGTKNSKADFSDASGVAQVKRCWLYGVADNYMDVTNNKYYFPTEIEKDYVDDMKAEG